MQHAKIAWSVVSTAITAIEETSNALPGQHTKQTLMDHRMFEEMRYGYDVALVALRTAWLEEQGTEHP